MRVWRDSLGVICIAVYLVFFSISWADALSDTPPPKKTPRVLSAQSAPMSIKTGLPDPNRLLALTNQARSNSGITALQPNQTLTTIAQQRANDMVSRRYYAHRSPEGTYYYDTLKATEFRETYSCENLGMDPSLSADAYVSQWLLSEHGHKECLLNQQTRFVGYGVAELPFDTARSDNKTYIIVAIHASN